MDINTLLRYKGLSIQYGTSKLGKAFLQTGISLCPTGKAGHKLHVRGLPDLVVGPWELELEYFDGQAEVSNPAYNQALPVHLS